MKIFESEIITKEHNISTGSLIVENAKLLVAINGGYIEIKNLQIEGKKRMNATDFLRGNSVDGRIVH